MSFCKCPEPQPATRESFIGIGPAGETIKVCTACGKQRGCTVDWDTDTYTFEEIAEKVYDAWLLAFRHTYPTESCNTSKPEASRDNFVMGVDIPGNHLGHKYYISLVDALSGTWVFNKFDELVLFLNQWCIPYFQNRLNKSQPGGFLTHTYTIMEEDL